MIIQAAVRQLGSNLLHLELDGRNRTGSALCKSVLSPTYHGTGAPLVAQVVKCLPAMWETWVQSLGREDPLEKEMATHSSILAWKTPLMEELGGLQSRGSPRVKHD